MRLITFDFSFVEAILVDDFLYCFLDLLGLTAVLQMNHAEYYYLRLES